MAVRNTVGGFPWGHEVAANRCTPEEGHRKWALFIPLVCSPRGNARIVGEGHIYENDGPTHWIGSPFHPQLVRATAPTPI